jgi:hypothetical protein
MSSSIQIQDGFVLFLDILGFRNKVKNLRTETEFRALFVLLSSLQEEAKRLSLTGSYLSDLKALTFSDSIILTIPYESQHNGIYLACMAIIRVGMLFQNILINENYLSRGYIVRGRYIHHEEILLGPAFIDAYEKEKNVGDYPFIEIDPDIINEAKKTIQPSQNMSSIFDLLIQVPGEKKYFLNYLNEKQAHQQYVQSLDQLSNLIELAKRQIAEYTDKEIQRKWDYFLNYAAEILNKRCQ